MKQITITFLFISLSLFSFGQFEWEVEFSGVPESPFFPDADMDFTEDGFLIVRKRQAHEVSLYGELKYTYLLDRPDAFNYLAQRTFIKKIDSSYISIRYNHDDREMNVHRLHVDNHFIYEKKFYLKTSNPYKKSMPAAALNDADQLLIGGVDTLYFLDALTGQLIWKKHHSGQFVDVFSENINFYIVDYDGNISKLDNQGNIQWTVSHTMKCHALMVSSNQLIIGGQNNSNQAQIIFTDKNGTFISTQTFGNGQISDLKPTNDGGFVLTGQIDDEAVLIRLDQNKNILWQKTFDAEHGRKVVIAPHGYAMLTTSPTKLIVTNENGNISSTKKNKIIDQGIGYLDAGNVTALTNSTGRFFGQHSYYNIGFEAPKGSGVNAITAACIMIGGLDASNSLHIRGKEFDFSPFKSGFKGEDNKVFNKVWQIRKETLNHFKNDFDDGTFDHPIPFHILTYPAKGNPYFRGYFDLPYNISRDMAPFTDVNGDGLYNAYDGDYPLMKGDMMLLWMMNDDTTSLPYHPHLEGVPLGINMLCYMYSYECIDNPSIDNSVFLEIDMTNISTNDYHDVHIGLIGDLNLGCWMDDYIGVDTASNTSYVYNKVAMDNGNGDCGSAPSPPAYTGTPPVVTQTLLSHPISSHMIRNVAFAVNDTAQKDYNNLKGLWLDGTPITVGGTGYQSSNQTTKYMFAGNPSDNSQWNMCSVNYAEPDLHSMLSTEALTFTQNETIQFSAMYSFKENVLLPCPDISTEVIPDINLLKGYYDSGELDWNINLGSDRVVNFGTQGTATITLDPNYSNGISYLWSTGQTSQTIDISSPGTYTVTVTHTDGCKKTDEIVISSPTNTNEPFQYLNATVFPNPTDDMITISIENNQYQNIEYTFSNALGQGLKTFQSPQSIIEMSLNGYPRGIYFLTLISEGQALKTFKIVKH